ncbi:hypothetical protein ABZP36_026627 [Zizania latifolia]
MAPTASWPQLQPWMTKTSSDDVHSCSAAKMNHGFGSLTGCNPATHHQHAALHAPSYHALAKTPPSYITHFWALARIVSTGSNILIPDIGGTTFKEIAEGIINSAEITVSWTSYVESILVNCTRCERQKQPCAFSSRRNRTFCMSQEHHATSSVAAFVVLSLIMATALYLSLKSREMTEEDKLKVRQMALVALWCIQWNPRNRPSMTKAINMLTGRLQNIQVLLQIYNVNGWMDMDLTVVGAAHATAVVVEVVEEFAKVGSVEDGAAIAVQDIAGLGGTDHRGCHDHTLLSSQSISQLFVSISLEAPVSTMQKMTGLPLVAALLLSLVVRHGADLQQQLQATAWEDKDFFSHCPPSRCRKHGPEVRFPFRLSSGDTPPSCGLPCLNLACSGPDTILNNKYLGRPYKVTAIDYRSAILTIVPLADNNSPSSSRCWLPKPISPSLQHASSNLQGMAPDPCLTYSWDDAAVVSCLSEFVPASIPAAAGSITGPISCLSNDSHFSYLVDYRLPMSLIPSDCEAVSDGSIPIAGTTLFNSDGVSAFSEKAERVISSSQTTVCMSE